MKNLEQGKETRTMTGIERLLNTCSEAFERIRQLQELLAEQDEFLDEQMGLLKQTSDVVLQLKNFIQMQKDSPADPE